MALMLVNQLGVGYQVKLPQVNYHALLPSAEVLIKSLDLDGDIDVRHVEHIDGFWGPIYALVVIFMCVTAVYLVAYYIELRDQRARRQSVRLSQVNIW